MFEIKTTVVFSQIVIGNDEKPITLNKIIKELKEKLIMQDFKEMIIWFPAIHAFAHKTNN